MTKKGRDIIINYTLEQIEKFINPDDFLSNKQAIYCTYKVDKNN